MKYNTQRDKLILPEYGRSIQTMVDFAVNLPTKQMRQECAETIVGLMTKIHSGNKEKEEEVTQKMWNHLAALSGYKLDVDFPVEIDDLRQVYDKRESVAYPQTKITKRHYGKLIEQLAEKVESLPEGEEKTELTRLLLNQMKRDLGAWNKNVMSDEKVIDDVREYTHGKVNLQVQDMQLISEAEVIIGTGQQKSNAKRRKRK